MRAMEDGLEVSVCRAFPSSFSLDCGKDGQPVTVLANGTPFVYLLDPCTARLQAAVKFVCGVEYCGPLYSHPHTSQLALCCLRNGSILAVNVQNALTRGPNVATPPSKHAGDIFASLLGSEANEGSDSAYAYTVSYQGDVSVVISSCQHPNWIPLSATVYFNKLLQVLRDTRTGEHVLGVSRQCGQAEVCGCRVPQFPVTVPAQYTLSTLQQSTCRDGSRLALPTLSYRPCHVVVQSTGNISSHAVSIHEEFFLQLFGPQAKLAASPVLLIGSQSGNVFHISVSDLECIDMRSSMKCLCNLEQPVVDIHVAHLPMDASSSQSASDVQEGATMAEGGGRGMNTLFIVGQRGRIAVWRMGCPGQSFAAFAEFHVPGPILSSVLLPGRCLVYSTVNGCYSVCLKPQCTERPHIPPTDSPVFLPELAFRCPSAISPSVAFLVPPPKPQSSLMSHTPTTDLLTVSLMGRIGRLAIGRELGPSVAAGAVQAAQDLKQTLTSIQATSKMVDGLKEKISSVDEALVELNSALSLLCEVAASDRTAHPTDQRESGPFLCQLTPTFEPVGVSGRIACVRVQLTYQVGRRPLGNGWSLVLHLCPGWYPPHRGGGAITSQVVPLSGMQGGRSVQTRVNLCQPSLRPLTCTLQCLLHYNTAGLELGGGRSRKGCGQSEQDNSAGVLLPLCTREFDALDFMEPNLDSSQFGQELISDDSIGSVSGTHSASSLPNPQALVHSLGLPVLASVIRELCTEGSDRPTASLLSSLFTYPIQVCTSALSSEIALRAYDGSAVSLRADQPQPSGAVVLTVMTSHRAMLSEVCTGLHRRLGPMRTEESCDRSHDQLCLQLHALEKLFRESSSLLGELASHQGLSGSSTDGPQPLRERTFQLYSALRQ